MECSSCNGKTYVVDSRQDEDTRRRRYCCRSCKTRFTACEITVAEYERLQSVRINMAAINAAIDTLNAVKKAVRG
jgi:transcriptional regulator NrdR family protein